MSFKGSFFKKKLPHHYNSTDASLKKLLGVWDLTAFGIAAILGAGIFTTIGTATAAGGPAVIFLFICTAIACGFSALCYAEFASMMPISGSAYSYAYAAFGELVAWVIGWNLVLEYAISNIAVSISWSQYFVDFLQSYHIHIPAYLVMNYFTAQDAFLQITQQALSGLINPSSSIYEGYVAWNTAPLLLGTRIIFNLPNIIITCLITWIVFLGMQESRFVSNILVILKVLVILLIIIVGVNYVHPQNWVPFAPHGFSGVLKGVSSIFFAYIGFDAISTTAEECKNPQKDMPRAMIYALMICTLLYAVIALILTGMVPSHELRVADPLAYVFGPKGANLFWIQQIVQFGAVIALSTVLLIYQIGQSRIWMTMSRDGLLPKIFSSIHQKYKTPWFSTLITGVIIIVPSFFWGLSEVTDLASIGTLTSFVIVCAGILVKNPHGKPNSRFVTPYINGKFIFPALLIAFCSGMFFLNPDWFFIFLKTQEPWTNQVPVWCFLLLTFGLLLLTYFKNLSFIPILGVLSCSFLLSQIDTIIWVRFFWWVILGLIIYFFYGMHHSMLKKEN